MNVTAIGLSESTKTTSKAKKSPQKEVALSVETQQPVSYSNGVYGKSLLNISNKKNNVSFGMEPVTIFLLVYYGSIALLGGGVYAVGKLNEKRRAKREAKEKEFKNSISEEVAKKAQQLQISFDQAQKLYSAENAVALIKPTLDGKEIGLNKVIGYGLETKKLLNNVVVPIISAQNQVGAKSKLKDEIPNGIVLFGPPGTGKSWIADALGEHLKYFGCEFKTIPLTPSDHDANAANIRKYFTEAKEHFKETGKYTLLLMEDFDLKLKDRKNNQQCEPEVSELLEQAEFCAGDGVVWVGTANNVKNIDPAILRAGRNDIKMLITPMDDFEVADMIKCSLKKYDLKEKIDYDAVLDKMEKEKMLFTPAELDEIVKNSKRGLMGGNSPVTTDLLLENIMDYQANNLPTLDADMRKKAFEDKDYVKKL